MRRPKSAIFVVLLLALAGCHGQRPVIEHLPAPLIPQRQRLIRTSPVVRPPRIAKPKRTSPTLRNTTVVVDAGHGGTDPGALGRTHLPEKTIVLSIAREVARVLRAQGAEVIMTRNSDVFVKLKERAATAERTRADLLVSIHADSAGRASAAGTGLFIARNASTNSQRVANRIHSAFQGAGIPCRGIQRKGFVVLKAHSRPSVLVECGFLTNSSDARKLSTPSYRTTIAELIAKGIADHLSG